MYASTAAKSYILNYMWSAEILIISKAAYGRRLCTIALDQILNQKPQQVIQSIKRLRL